MFKKIGNPAPAAPEGLGAAPAGLGAPPADPNAAPAPSFKIIYSPLDSLGKILADLDFKSFLQSNFGTDHEQLAHKVWVMYGGSENELQKGKPGSRLDTPASSDPTQLETIQNNEYNQTRDKRWERLPKGVSIDEITNPQAIQLSITGGFESLSKAVAKPPAAASSQKWLKIAELADKNGYYKIADKIQKLTNEFISR